MTRFIQLDEEGYFAFDGIRVTDEEYGAHLLTHLHYDNRLLLTDSGATPSSGVHSPMDEVAVEAFDQPLVARHILRTDALWQLALPYGVMAPLNLNQIFADEWDRFLGFTEVRNEKGEKNILPYVMSRSAQSDFFQAVDEFDDEGFRYEGQYYPIQPWLNSHVDVRSSEFWSQIYRDWKDDPSKPGWELGQPALPLRDVMPQLKLMKSKIAVIGAGSAHDAAFLASQGHLVTAIDISPEAIARARDQYKDVPGLHFVQADAFDMPTELKGQFDLIFEHTFFCAVDPTFRQKVVDVYTQMLREGGHLLGIFFVMDRGERPPFGATEWEIRERLRKNFSFLYWTRWKKSLPRRMGKELVIYARKSMA